MKSLIFTPWLLAGAVSAAATIHLCGDSTMARQSDKKIQGWGEYLQYSFNLSEFVVKNSAISGRSARSFTREGRFKDVAAAVKPGDWVVVEFGHNDGGSLSKDNGRSDCGGDGAQTCETTYK
jgi:rhamnogalacturonan acetylesterase